ncbi:response regulator [Xanthobacter sp. KR7-65]|uniref:response regulator transcription factor n=1 Tax=Xanthobacter sp. KR7-65 TaxID=3156612 RepID=UPI0032B54A9E
MNAGDTEFPATLLIVEADILVRHVLADYLRSCGYEVLEATSGEEAQIILEVEAERVEAVLADAASTGGLDGFALARWLRETHPHIDVVLAGSPAMAATQATDLCEDGPAVEKPYQPQHVLERIKWLKAQRDRRR